MTHHLPKLFRINLTGPSLGLFLAVIFPAHAQEAEDKPVPVPTKDLVDQWLKTERLLSQEAQDWKDEQEHTSQLLELYRKELTLLDEELAKAGKNAGVVDEEAEELKAKLASSEAARRKAIAFLVKLKPRITKLVERFPAPLQDTIEEETFLLKNPITNKNSAEALRAIIKILQEGSRFNRAYTFDEQEIKLGETSYSAKIMYFGLSRAYFLAGEKAGIALPGETGWTFEERNELADELTKAFAIQAKESPSGFFNVPLKK